MCSLLRRYGRFGSLTNDTDFNACVTDFRAIHINGIYAPKRNFCQYIVIYRRIGACVPVSTKHFILFYI